MESLLLLHMLSSLVVFATISEAIKVSSATLTIASRWSFSRLIIPLFCQLLRYNISYTVSLLRVRRRSVMTLLAILNIRSGLLLIAGVLNTLRAICANCG